MKYIQIVRRLSLEELLITLLTMLIGQEGKDWAYYEEDAAWWAVRLYTRRN